jgi:hypothetical protein
LLPTLSFFFKHFSFKQFIGAGTIYCGSGSVSGSGSKFGTEPRSYLALLQEKFLYKILPFNVRSSIVSQKFVISFFIFFLWILFMLNPDSELEYMTVPLPLWQKVVVLAFLVPQTWF